MDSELASRAGGAAAESWMQLRRRRRAESRGSDVVPMVLCCSSGASFLSFRSLSKFSDLFGTLRSDFRTRAQDSQTVCARLPNCMLREGDSSPKARTRFRAQSRNTRISQICTPHSKGRPIKCGSHLSGLMMIRPVLKINANIRRLRMI